MDDEQNSVKDRAALSSIPKKKENIRVFVQRKRLSSGISYKAMSSPPNSVQQLTTLIEKRLNVNKKSARDNKNIILVNYKPIFVNSRQQKSIPTTSAAGKKSSSSNLHHHERHMATAPKSDDNSHASNHPSVSVGVPDVEDPFMFIEMMYQQLFNEDGQLRSDTEPAVLADCVKQIVTHSRRNSMAHRDSILPHLYQRKCPMPSKTASLSSSPHFISNTFSEEEEEEQQQQPPYVQPQKNLTANTSRRSSKRSSMDHTDHHQQQLHAFLHSYYRHQKQPPLNQSRMKSDHLFSVDDTDNEDLDTFSDLNSYRKTVHTSPPISIDEDTTHADSRFLSSGYQSEMAHRRCSNCSHPAQTSVTSSISLLSIIQPIRDAVTKYLNFILISKNILIIPLFIFFLRQRSMIISN